MGLLPLPSLGFCLVRRMVASRPWCA
jgi:hypothetical protein